MAGLERGVYMAVITEELARKMSDGNTIRVLPRDIITPAARTYLQEKHIEIIHDNPSENKVSGEDYTTLFGATLHQKPEHMTHLRGNLLVFKDHPRIALRGKIDSLEAAIILVQIKAQQMGKDKMVSDLQEIITFIRLLLRSEVSGEPLETFTLQGLDEKALREQSYHPSQYFGIRHFLPSYEYGELVAELNQLRTKARETELAALAAFKDEYGSVERVDLIRGFNRLSSLFWIMMFKVRSNQY